MGVCPAFEGRFHDNSALTPAADPEKAEKIQKKYLTEKNTEGEQNKKYPKSEANMKKDIMLNSVRQNIWQSFCGIERNKKICINATSV